MHFQHYKQTAIPSRITVARVRNNGRGFGIAATGGPSSVSVTFLKVLFFLSKLLNN